MKTRLFATDVAEADITKNVNYSGDQLHDGITWVLPDEIIVL